MMIGSSNVYRNYKPEKFINFKEYKMVKCVDMESFDAHMTGIEPSVTEVVISVLENFLDRAVKSTDKMEMAEEIANAVNKYFEIVERAARANPGSKFVLVDPIMRPKLVWYDPALDMIKDTHREGTTRIGVTNVSRVDVIARLSQEFEKDGVHLTPTSGKTFVTGIMEEAEKVFEAQLVDLSDEEENNDKRKKTKGGDRSIEMRVDLLERETRERRFNDNLLFARTREEIDTAANKLKEDRIVMTGLSSSIPAPADREKKNAWLRGVVIETIRKFKPDFNGKIGFINQGKNNGRDIPMVEAKLESVEVATAVRKAFAEKRKDGDGKAMGRLYVANSVSLSTRVRIDILKSIAKKVTNDKDAAHVAAYSSRPILHVKSGTGAGATNRAYTFIDAVIKFGEALRYEDLDEAYKKAGGAFRGQLEQHFVVLRETIVPTKVRSGKRDRDERGENSGVEPKNKKQSGENRGR
jgi:hypothetical protein